MTQWIKDIRSGEGNRKHHKGWTRFNEKEVTSSVHF